MGKKAVSGTGRKDKVSSIKNEEKFFGFIKALLEREDHGYLAKMRLSAEMRRLASKMVNHLLAEGALQQAIQLVTEVGNTKDAHKVYQHYLKSDHTEEIDTSLFHMLIGVGAGGDLQYYHVTFLTGYQALQDGRMDRLISYCKRIRSGRPLLNLANLQMGDFWRAMRVAGTNSVDLSWDSDGVHEFIKPEVIIRNLMLALALGEGDAKKVLLCFGNRLHRKFGHRQIFTDAEIPEAVLAWEMSGTPEGWQRAANAYSLESKFLDAFRCFTKLERWDDQVSMLKLAVEHGQLHEALEAYGAQDPKLVPPMEPELLEELFDLAVQSAKRRVREGLETYLVEHDNGNPFPKSDMIEDESESGWKTRCRLETQIAHHEIEALAGDCHLGKMYPEKRAEFLAVDLYAGGYGEVMRCIKLQLYKHLALWNVLSALKYELNLDRTRIRFGAQSPLRVLGWAIEQLELVTDQQDGDMKALILTLQQLRDSGLSDWREKPIDSLALHCFMEQVGLKVLIAVRKDYYESVTAGIRLELKKLE